MASLSALLEEHEAVSEAHRGVEFVEMPIKTILNRCDSPRMPFRWTINPYRGCEFGCKYCYARYAHEFMELDAHAFEDKIYAKESPALVLRHELARASKADSIAIGTATDPYQPAERRVRAARG